MPAKNGNGKPKGVYQKLAEIQAEIGYVEKTGKVDYGRTHYEHMQEHGLLGIIKPLLRERNCLLSLDIPETRRDGNHLDGTAFLSIIDADQDPEVQRTVQAVVGDKVVDTKKWVANPLHAHTIRLPSEAIDSSDKASNKLSTNANKYLLQKLFQVPTEKVDDVEGSDESHNTQSTRSNGGTRKQKLVDSVTEDARTAISSGTDSEKIKAKLQADFGKDRIADLTIPQLESFRSWLAS